MYLLLPGFLTSRLLLNAINQRVIFQPPRSYAQTGLIMLLTLQSCSEIFLDTVRLVIMGNYSDSDRFHQERRRWMSRACIYLWLPL